MRDCTTARLGWTDAGGKEGEVGHRVSRVGVRKFREKRQARHRPPKLSLLGVETRVFVWRKPFHSVAKARNVGVRQSYNFAALLPNKLALLGIRYNDQGHDKCDTIIHRLREHVAVRVGLRCAKLLNYCTSEHEMPHPPQPSSPRCFERPMEAFYDRG